MTDRCRLFIAVNFPENAFKKVIDVQNYLHSTHSVDARWTRSENLHLTLKFLGEIDSSEISTLVTLLNEISFIKFNVQFSNVGVFRSRKRIRIIWIHVTGEKIVELQKDIDLKLQALFKPEHRFMSHLTIGRVKKVIDPSLLKQVLNNVKTDTTEFSINHFELIQSTLSHSGPIYQTIASFYGDCD